MDPLDVEALGRDFAAGDSDAMRGAYERFSPLVFTWRAAYLRRRRGLGCGALLREETCPESSLSIDTLIEEPFLDSPVGICLPLLGTLRAPIH